MVAPQTGPTYRAAVFALVKPSRPMRRYVEAYWYVRNKEAVDSGVTTTPRPGGVLTVNLGRPNRAADGTPTPTLSLLGIQTMKRTWLAAADTHFAMALLTPAGLARLAPGSGTAIVDSFVDLGAAVGDGAATELHASAASWPHAPWMALDHWLRARLLGGDGDRPADLFETACVILSDAGRVDAASARLGVSRRHLSRTVSCQLGIGPKLLLDLHRLDRSLRAVQFGVGAGASGFSDQAHQVREWSRRLGVTPGRYACDGPSVFARTMGAQNDGPAFYL